MRNYLIGLTGALLCLAGCSSSQTPPAASEAKIANAAAPASGFANLDRWLCHPGKAGSDACAVDLTTTIVAADGSAKTEAFEAATDPAIDCFYIYPTVSNDPGGNSDFEANAEELNVIAQQFARFASVCRPYAPIYRQYTLTALRARETGNPVEADRDLPYNDAKAAWDHYLANENDGRGVVLVGHSQGAGIIQRMLADDILGTDAEDLLVSAMPIGSTIAIDAATNTFNGMEMCASPGQIGCMVAYVTFRASQPPPPGSRFGKVNAPGKKAACVNPARLTRGESALRAYLSTTNLIGERTDGFADGLSVDTGFVAMPGLLSGQCVTRGEHAYFSVTEHGDPADPRADTISGDVVVNGEVIQDWGLHLIDMHVAMGDLIETVRLQSETWTEQE